MSATFFSFLMYSKRMDPLFISSHINWNFISICFDLWWMTGLFAKTILDWLLQWIVVGCLKDTSFVTFLNSALRYRTSWFANEIVINSASYVDKAIEFCFLDFHEIIGLSSANLKQYPFMLFLSLKLAQSASQNCNFLNISDWLILPYK